MMTTQWWKSFSGGLVALFVCLSAPTTSAQVNTCPNVQVGTLLTTDPAVYSDCGLDVGGSLNTPALAYDVAPNSRMEAILMGIPANFSPSPAPIDLGGYTARSIINAGSGYTGDCSDQTYTMNVDFLSSAASSGDVICARFNAVDPEAIWIRGEWNGTTFVNPLAVTNMNVSAGSSSSSSSAATAVPTLPLFGVMLLGGLLGLFGLRKLKQ